MKLLYYLTFVALGLSCRFITAQAPDLLPDSAPAPVPADITPTLPGPLDPMGEDGPAPAKPPQACYRVTLEDGSMMLGEIDGKSEISLKSKVGDVKIALQQVARIDEAFAEEDRVTVTFSNGDRLTGKLSIEDVKLKTAWGELTVKPNGLYSLEAGKLFEQCGPVTRRSLDGRSVVTITRKHFRFQPLVEGPSAYPTGTTVRGPNTTSSGTWSAPTAPVIIYPPTPSPVNRLVPAH